MSECEAAQQGASLVVFPEAYVPGYPAWVWRLKPGADMALSSELHARLRDESVDLSGDHLQPVKEAAAAHAVTVVLGINEVDSDFSRTTLFNSVVVIDVHALHQREINNRPPHGILRKFSKSLAWNPPICRNVSARLNWTAIRNPPPAPPVNANGVSSSSPGLAADPDAYPGPPALPDPNRNAVPPGGMDRASRGAQPRWGNGVGVKEMCIWRDEVSDRAKCKED